MKKKDLLEILKQLTKGDFDELIFNLDVPNGSIPAETLTQQERAIDLFKWITSIRGCGLEKLEAELKDMGVISENLNVNDNLTPSLNENPPATPQPNSSEYVDPGLGDPPKSPLIRGTLNQPTPLSRNPTEYSESHDDSDRGLGDPPKSPLIRGTLNQLPPFSKRVGGDQTLLEQPLTSSDSGSQNLTTIKIFLASSSELKSDRQQFEQLIYRETKNYIKEGIFLELVMWEDFIDYMSSTRLQDEYNKAIGECDIFVSLFYTKVGKYTEEEFLKALETFKANDKPKIYTYFKKGKVDISEMREEQIMSLLNFKEKLSDFGHFYTQYSDINDLKYQFSQQLIKILPQILKKKITI